MTGPSRPEIFRPRPEEAPRPAGVPLDLAEHYGTPLYVYQLDAVRRAVTGLRAALPDPVGIHYSAKANPHPRIAAAMAAQGVDLEISSTGELATVVAAAVALDRTLYTGPAKTPAELRAAVAAGIRHFSVESEVDRDRLAAAAAGRPVDYLVRLYDAAATGAAGLRMSGGPTQFGVDVAGLRSGGALLEPAGSARPVGFHTFTATNVASEEALLAELEANVAMAARTAATTGFAPSIVDIGGGFGAPYAVPGERPRYPRLRDALAASLDRHLPGWRAGEPRVVVESGRHLVAEAGLLLTTVMDIKERAGQRYLVCDAGINTLGGMSGTGRLLPPIAQPAGQPADPPNAILVGPLCTPLDILSRSATVKAPAVGDVLAVPNVGAYGLTASLVAFLGRPLPVEVVLDGDTLIEARRLELTTTPVPGPTGPDTNR